MIRSECILRTSGLLLDVSKEGRDFAFIGGRAAVVAERGVSRGRLAELLEGVEVLLAVGEPRLEHRLGEEAFPARSRWSRWWGSGRRRIAVAWTVYTAIAAVITGTSTVAPLAAAIGIVRARLGA